MDLNCSVFRFFETRVRGLFRMIFDGYTFLLLRCLMRWICSRAALSHVYLPAYIPIMFENVTVRCVVQQGRQFSILEDFSFDKPPDCSNYGDDCGYLFIYILFFISRSIHCVIYTAVLRYCDAAVLRPYYWVKAEKAKQFYKWWPISVTH